MTSKTNRILFYLLLCIPLRSLLIYLTYKYSNLSNQVAQNPKYLNYFSYFYLIIGILFIYKYIISTYPTYPNYLYKKQNSSFVKLVRVSEHSKVGFFGGQVWWNNYRLIHGVIYILFFYLNLIKYKNTYKLLIFDLLIGLIGFVNNYYD